MERWDEPAALARMRRAFEYVELRRDQESSEEPTLGEREALDEMRRAFEAQDMRALRNATRRYIREAPYEESGLGKSEHENSVCGNPEHKESEKKDS